MAIHVGRKSHCALIMADDAHVDLDAPSAAPDGPAALAQACLQCAPVGGAAQLASAGAEGLRVPAGRDARWALRSEARARVSARAAVWPLVREARRFDSAWLLDSAPLPAFHEGCSGAAGELRAGWG